MQPAILPYRPNMPGSISLQGPEERLLGSAKTGSTITSGATGSKITAYASENGVVDLNRLYAGVTPAAANANIVPPRLDITQGSRLSGFLVRGSERLLFAGESPLGKYSAINGYQGWRQVAPLPTVSFSSGDTLELTMEQTSGADAIAGFGSAFRPNSIAGRQVKAPWAPNSYGVDLSSSDTTLTDDASTDITITVTQAGWLILSDASFSAYLAGGTANLTTFDVTGNCFLTGYKTDAYASTALILSGSGETAFAPASILSAQRANRLVRFPIVRADSGNTITLSVFHKLGTNIQGQFSVPFVPLSQQLLPPCAPPIC